MDEGVVNARELARFLNVQERRIQQLAREDLVVRVARGRYDLRASVARYVGSLQSRLASQGPELGEDPAEAERTALARVRRETAELELAEKRRKVLDRDQVERLLVSIAVGTQTRILAVPANVAIALAGEEDPQTIQARLDQELRAALTEIAEAGEDPEAATAPNSRG